MVVRRHGHLFGSDTSRYRLEPHTLSAMYFSLAATSVFGNSKVDIWGADPFRPGSYVASPRDLLEEADALACLDFPYAYRRRLRTNNVLERVNRELERRRRFAQVFPSRKLLVGMLGTVSSEMGEDRMSRKWLAGESIAPAPVPFCGSPSESTPGASWK